MSWALVGVLVRYSFRMLKIESDIGSRYQSEVASSHMEIGMAAESKQLQRSGLALQVQCALFARI